ncbi:type II toxin-antitoxin system RelE/ParE family toxin [Verminephrobacter aporrectodeae]|uniref:type II toxin-antitoxin system RelE/ParE family toxin n=1 Tax=Verminephrobacter aporrectodeae TaxID=1110389 RepID=UPI003F691836
MGGDHCANYYIKLQSILRDTREGRLPEVLKRKNLARWQLSERLPDVAPCKVVREREEGLIDADLGGPSLQEAQARAGGGKRGGYRTLASRPGSATGPCSCMGSRRAPRQTITQGWKAGAAYGRCPGRSASCTRFAPRQSGASCPAWTSGIRIARFIRSRAKRSTSCA